MEKVTKESIDLIISKNFNENFWFFELGRSQAMLTGESTIDNQFMSSFYDKGVELWNKNIDKLKEFLCDKEKKEPKTFVKTVTNEGLIALIHNLIEYLKNDHRLASAIAIPLCGIAINKGIMTLCK
jgi:hypothetical protein